MKYRWMRTWIVIVLAALLAGMLPCALAEKNFNAVVTGDSMKVYSQKAPHKLLGTVPKGETVTVKDYQGKAALISYNGKTGIVRVSDLEKVTDAAQTGDSTQTDTASDAETSEGRDVVTTKAAKVYKKANAKSGYTKVKAGTALTLLSTSGNVAKVKRNGSVGYIDARCLSDSGADQDASALKTTENSAGSVQKYDRKAVETSKSCKVYERPSTSSASVSLEKGAQLVLLATKGSCAMVERDGKVGYMDKGNLIESTSVSGSNAAGNGSNSVDLSGNNEEIVYKFLVRKLGYNTAAAVGVMANIKYESGYKPTSGGDKGSSYGIVQWHAGRKSRLIEWCGSNGFDYTTLEGQLYYLDYELRNRYPAVHNRLMAIENTEQGAYDAAYDFCYNFEAPSNRASRSVTRANYARETLWVRYKT